MLKKIKAIDKKAQKEIKEKFGKKGVRLYKDVINNTIQPKTAKNILASFTDGIKSQKEKCEVKKARWVYRDFTIATMKGIVDCMTLYCWTVDDLIWLDNRLKGKAAEILVAVNKGEFDSMKPLMVEDYIKNSLIVTAGLVSQEQKVYEVFAEGGDISKYIETREKELGFDKLGEVKVSDIESIRSNRQMDVAHKFGSTNFGENQKHSADVLSSIIKDIELGKYDDVSDVDFEKQIYSIINSITLRISIHVPQNDVDDEYTTSVRIKRAQFLNRIVEDTKDQMVGYDAPLTLLESLHKETRDKLDDKEFDCLSDKEFYRIVNEDVIAKATSCFEEALRLRRERKDDTTGTITEETKEVVGDILDDTEKVIETVCDGLDKVSDTIQKAIDMVKPPVEEVYEETFDDGKYPAKSAKKKNKKEREEGK